MANYSAIKAAVNAYIKQNGKKEITGHILNSVLNATIDSLGKEFQFGGVLTPANDPGRPDQNVAYIGAAGTYPNFDGLVIASGTIGIFMWNGDWSFATIPVGKDYDNDIQSLTHGLQELYENIQELSDDVIHLDGINEEDLSIPDGGKLQFANRAYNAQQPNGMGYVILRKNKTFAEQVTESNTIYEVRYPFTLAADFQIPSGCVLDFRGGSIDGVFELDLNGATISGTGKWCGTSLSLTGAVSDEYRFEWFAGLTDSARLGKALNAIPGRCRLIGGTCTIGSTISLTRSGLREIFLVGFRFSLSADMFTTSAAYIQVPSFDNCVFIGNGYSIFAGDYAIGGQFTNCVVNETSFISGTTKTLQSLYVRGCSILNTTVNFIKVYRLYDCHIAQCSCESGNTTLIDTRDSTYTTGGTQQLWVSDSLFEGFTAVIFKLSGGFIKILNNYFTGNAAEVATVTRQTGAGNLLNFEIGGNTVVSPVTAFTITGGFASSNRVVISVHDNSYNSGESGTYLISGIPDLSFDTFVNNKVGDADDRLYQTAVRYLDYTYKSPTYNTTYFTHQSGGAVVLGALAIVQIKFKAATAIGSSLANAITGLPTPVYAENWYLKDGDTETTIKASLNASGAIGITGKTTASKVYTLKMVYLTSSTKEI